MKIFLEDFIVPFRSFWSLAFTRFKGQKLSHASFIDQLATTSCVSDTLRSNPVSGLAGYIHVQLLLFIHILLRRDVKDKGKRSDFTVRD